MLAFQDHSWATQVLKASDYSDNVFDIEVEGVLGVVEVKIRMVELRVA